jgi:uncharacterized protein (DUF305 family)
MHCAGFMKALAIAVVLGLGDVTGADPEPTGEQVLHEVMQKGAEEFQSMPMTGDLDHDFVWAVKKHHQSAIAMARVLLKYGKDPRARQLAKKIIDSERREVGDLDRWMAQHHQPMN